jgi:UDP-glucuronate 4-epimerase
VEGQALTLYGDGTQGRDYTYCDDVVAGIASAIRWTSTAEPGVECFNLGGNRVVTLKELVAGIGDALGIEPSVSWAPLPPGDVQLTSADLTKSRRILGYEPVVPLRDGLARFVAWYRATHASGAAR